MKLKTLKELRFDFDGDITELYSDTREDGVYSNADELKQEGIKWINYFNKNPGDMEKEKRDGIVEGLMLFLDIGVDEIK